MTRFVRIIPDPDPRAETGSRIRVDYDPDDTGAFCIADENVLPEKLLDPNCYHVQTVANIELGRDTVRTLRDSLIELCQHLDEEEREAKRITPLVDNEVTIERLTDETIGKFRQRLPNAAWRLAHDCLIAVGAKPSPHPGGKREARQRVADAINAVERMAREHVFVEFDAVDNQQRPVCRCGRPFAWRDSKALARADHALHLRHERDAIVVQVVGPGCHLDPDVSSKKGTP